MNRQQRRAANASKPIRSQKEADETYNYLVATSVKVLGIPEDEAGKRVAAMLKTDIVGFDPNDKEMCMRIDLFMQIPSEKHGEPLPFLLQPKAYQAAFFECVENDELMGQYERLSKVKLRDKIKSGIGSDSLELDFKTGATYGELHKFETFFRDTIWSRFMDHVAPQN